MYSSIVGLVNRMLGGLLRISLLESTSGNACVRSLSDGCLSTVSPVNFAYFIPLAALHHAWSLFFWLAMSAFKG